MPAKSKAQRRVAAAAKQVKQGTLRLADLPPGMRDDVKSMMSMSLAQLDEFASTKEKKLPQRVKPKARKRA